MFSSSQYLPKYDDISISIGDLSKTITCPSLLGYELVIRILKNHYTGARSRFLLAI